MSRLQVLLIEDDPDHAELIRHALEGQPLVGTIVHAPDGTEGLRYLRADGDVDHTRPDVVLLDLKLPGKSGVEVLREIKADETLRCIPVVVLTTSDAEADMLEAYRYHANSYLVKPVDYGQFKAMIDDMSYYWGRLNRSPHVDLADRA